MASAFDKASLVMLPNAYKDQKLYSVKPTDRSGDFTFSRDGAGASPATRVGADGLIEKGRENLMLQSNQFDTTWSTINSTITSGQSGYDGSSDAWLLTASSTSNARVQQNISFSGVHTFSVYAKSGTSDILYIRSNGALTYGCYFDLSNGIVSNSSNLITESITSIGNGWYKCSITFNASSSSDVRAYVVDGFGSILVTNGANIYIQDAQLELGLAATDYIETATAPVSAGLLGDMPRLDYSGGATCPSLLLEPSRTNLVGYSEYFEGSVWNYVSGVTRTANAGTSPEGVNNAYLLTEDSTLAPHRIGQSAWSQSVENTSVSVFAKSNGREFIVLSNANMSPSMSTWFNLSTGEVGTESPDIINASIEPFANGWYRCSLTYLPTKGNTYPTIYLSDSDGVSVSYQGDGVSGVYLYGYQIEVGASYPTSYIPTYGSSVLRGGDVCNDAGDVNTFNSTEGVLYFEVSALNEENSLNYITIGQNINDGIIGFSFYTGSNRILLDYWVGGVETYHLESVSDITQLNKIAICYNGTSIKGYINGVSVWDTSVTALATNAISQLNFSYGQTANKFIGNAKQVLYFPEALSDAECINLTTL